MNKQMNKDEMVEVRKEVLTETVAAQQEMMDIIIAQNAMIDGLLDDIAELLDEKTELEIELKNLERKQAKYKPAVVENGILVSLERIII